MLPCCTERDCNVKITELALARVSRMQDHGIARFLGVYILNCIVLYTRIVLCSRVAVNSIVEYMYVCAM